MGRSSLFNLSVIPKKPLRMLTDRRMNLEVPTYPVNTMLLVARTQSSERHLLSWPKDCLVIEERKDVLRRGNSAVVHI
jgi:hypothetical protein